MSALDRWLCDGPPVRCADCDCSLGRLNDGEGQVVDGDHLCDACADVRWTVIDDLEDLACQEPA